MKNVCKKYKFAKVLSKHIIDEHDETLPPAIVEVKCKDTLNTSSGRTVIESVFGTFRQAFDDIIINIYCNFPNDEFATEITKLIDKDETNLKKWGSDLYSCQPTTELLQNWNTLTMHVCKAIENSLKESPTWSSDGNNFTKTLSRNFKLATRDKFSKRFHEQLLSRMCNQARNHFGLKGTMIAYWGKKNLLGTGVWEPKGTCLRNRPDEPSAAAQAIHRESAFRALIIRSRRRPVTHCSRAILCLMGNNQVYITNVYGKGTLFSVNQMADIAAQLLNKDLIHIDDKKVPSTEWYAPLRNYIYLNNDGRSYMDKKVMHPKEQDYKSTIKVQCTKCNESYPLVAMNGRNCRTCSPIQCPFCNKIIEAKVNQKIIRVRGSVICAPCYKKEVYTCPECDTPEFHNDTRDVKIKGKVLRWCFPCAEKLCICDFCQCAVPKDEMCGICNINFHMRHCATCCMMETEEEDR